MTEEQLQEHKELGIFYTLMENTRYENIKIETGNNTGLVTWVRLEEASLEIIYTNVNTTYNIKFKGVKIISDKRFDEESQISRDIREILNRLRNDVIQEFLSYE